MTLRKFKLRCYPFRNASFALVLRSVTIPEERRVESFQYALAHWAIAIVVFLSPVTISVYNSFLILYIPKMYAFDGYSTPIRNIVIGAYFPSITLSDFYSIRLSMHVHNLYTVGKLSSRPIQLSHFYSNWCTTS